MMSTLLYFFLTLFLLITVHELGHFLVARLCGVKVLRFSFGFGKVLACWHDKQGTEYAWSLFPLGGYVKMLDEAEGPVLEGERHLAFNNKSVWIRSAIIVAGPLFNFIFAFAALWLVLVLGIRSLAPMIDQVKPGSIAATAGLESKQEILALNNKKIDSWRDFQLALMPLVGSDERITLLVKSLTDGKKKLVIVPLTHWRMDRKYSNPLDEFGIVPFLPIIPPVIGEVEEESPAKTAGLQKGDVITHVAGKALRDWSILVDLVKQHPDELLSLSITRQGHRDTIRLRTGTMVVRGQKIGFLGVRSQPIVWPPQWLRLQRQGALQAFTHSFSQTIELIGATFSLMSRFVSGQLALQSLSGPIGIAQGASQSAHNGLTYYLSFLALISISLGVLNLLPIPMLDGGHLLYCLIEIVNRRPLSEKAKSLGFYLGFIILVSVMFLALSNDVSRLMTLRD